MPIQQFTGRLYIIMDSSDWVVHAAVGAERARTGNRRTGCIGKLWEHTMERARLAVAPSSALADDPVRELEQGFDSDVQAPPPSRRRRTALDRLYRCVRVLVHFVAPLACGHLPEDVAFEVHVVPRLTQGLGIFVLSLQVPALIAYVRHELIETTTETESG